MCAGRFWMIKFPSINIDKVYLCDNPALNVLFVDQQCKQWGLQSRLMRLTLKSPPQLASLPPPSEWDDGGGGHLIDGLKLHTSNIFKCLPSADSKSLSCFPFPCWSSFINRPSRLPGDAAPFSALHIYNNTCLHGSPGTSLGSTPHLQFCLAFHFVRVNNTIGHLWSPWLAFVFILPSVTTFLSPPVEILQRNGEIASWYMYVCLSSYKGNGMAG